MVETNPTAGRNSRSVLIRRLSRVEEIAVSLTTSESPPSLFERIGGSSFVVGDLRRMGYRRRHMIGKRGSNNRKDTCFQDSAHDEHNRRRGRRWKRCCGY